jgi:hypothetical protein
MSRPRSAKARGVFLPALIKASKYKGYTGLREKEMLLVKTGAE